MERSVPMWAPALLLAILALSGTARAAQVLLDSEKQMAFARHYLEREEYDRAAQELERLTYFFPEDPVVPRARLLTGWSYLKQRRFERARKILWEVQASYPRQPEGARALYLIGESYRVQGVGSEAAYYFDRVLAEYPESEAAEEARYRLGWIRMEAGRWEEASRTFDRVGEDSPLREVARDLSDLALEGPEIPRKSPAAAGVMAGVLPGLGHAYCGRYQDAAVSFLINGAFAWAAVEAFESDQEVLGGILGFLELSFYTGNIYSAVNTAHRTNEEAREGFLEGLPGRMGVTSSGGSWGLGWSFDF
jgi:outer membrane protein assembly factor BamD (BamD/ComL family)